MNRQHGFSLIMAIFLVVVLGGIAVFIGRISSMQAESSALDEEGSTVYQAAKAGVEWGVYLAMAGAAPTCNASTSFNLAMPVTVSSTVNYNVTVTCALTQATEGSSANNIKMYQITSTAKNAAMGDFYVERQLQATVIR